MYNNKHWLNDVLAGAGVGIASTQFAYWLYPKMQKLLCKHTTSSNTLLLSTYQNHSVGLVFVHSF
jgi:membrane-associated phospholipid phosphatase